MTTESETSQQQTDEKAAQAAFSASFVEEPQGTTAPTPEPTAAPQAEQATEPEKEQEAAQPAPSPEPTPAPYDAQAAIRKLQGQIGDLNSLLREQMKKKEEAGKPAVVTAVELKRMKEEYPELAQFLQEDLAESLSALAPRGPDSKELHELIDRGVAQGVEARMAELREAAVTDRHERWKTDLYADLKTGQKTPEYQAWLKTMSEAEGKAFEASQNPYFVIKKLDAFYEWRDKAAKAKQQQQDRLKANITPQGVPRAGQATPSDEEAMRKGFEAGFNS